MSSDSSDIAQSVQSPQPQIQLVSNVLQKSFELSKQLYAYTGFSNDFLESNAAKFSQFSTEVASLVDSQLDVTAGRIQSVKGALVQKAKQNTEQLASTAQEFWVVQRAAGLGNQLLVELEIQLSKLQIEVSEKYGVEILTKYAEVCSLENGVGCRFELVRQEEEEQKNVFVRLSEVAMAIQQLSGIVVSNYCDKVNTNLNNQIAVFTEKTKVIRSSLESFGEVLFGTVILQHIVNPLLNQVKVTYASAQDKVVVVFENIKKFEVQALIQQAQGKYEALKEATIVAVKGNKLSFTFAQEVFATGFDKIQENLSQLLKDISSLRVRLADSVVELYNQSVQEFQRKKAVKLGVQYQIVEQSPSGQEQNQEIVE